MPPVIREDPYGGYNFIVTINGVSNDGKLACIAQGTLLISDPPSSK